MVVTDIRHIGVTAVEKLVGREHLKATSLHKVFRHIAVDIHPFGLTETKVATESGVKAGLRLSNKLTIVVHIQLRATALLDRIVEVHLEDMTVCVLTHEGPNRIGTYRI